MSLAIHLPATPADTPSELPVLALDLTALWNRPVQGIQRVIREVAPLLIRDAVNRGWDVIGVRTKRSRQHMLQHWSGKAAFQHLPNDLDRIAAGIEVHESVSYATVRNQIRHRLEAYREAARDRHGRASSFSRMPAWLRQVRSHWLRRKPIEPITADAYLTFAAGILPAMTLPSVPPERSVYVLHDLIPLHFPAYYPPKVSRGFLNNLGDLALAPDLPRRRIVTASQHVATDIQRLFQGLIRTEINVDLISWGYDAKTFYPDPDAAFRRKHGIPDGPPVVVAVSTQDPRKRFAEIAEAVRQLDAYAVFLGKGTARREGNAIYLGHVSDAVVRQAYSSSDVVVNWSAAEGFGLPTIEALACGSRVVIPPDNPTLEEVSGTYATVAPEASVAGLCTAIQRAVSQPLQTPDLSAYCWQQTARRLSAMLWPEGA